MSLEQDLRDYGAALRMPPERDLWPAVAGRLEPTQPTRSHRRKALVAAFSVSVAVAVAVAVTPARGALLELLGFDGVTVVRVDRLQALDATAPLDFGRRTSLAAAAAAVPFPLHLPASDDPDEVYVGRDSPPAVTLVFGRREQPVLILSEFRPCCEQDSLQKEVPPGVPTREVTVDDVRGLWIGGTHLTRTPRGVRRAASTLVWERDGVIFRLEARLPLDEALALAESLRPR